MFRPLCGGPADIPGVPASEPPRPGSPPWPLAALLAACGGESSSDANEPAGTYQVKVDRRQLPDRAAPRPDLAAAARRPQHRQEDDAGADGDGLDRRQGGPGLVAAVRDPRPAAGPRPARPAGLGAGRSTTRGWPAPPNPAAPRPRTARPSTFGPLKPGETTEAVWKLSAVQGRQVHPALQDRRRPQRQAKAETTGGAAGGSFAAEIIRRAAGHRSHRQRRSRRNRSSASAASPANSRPPLRG